MVDDRNTYTTHPALHRTPQTCTPTTHHHQQQALRYGKRSKTSCARKYPPTHARGPARLIQPPQEYAEIQETPLEGITVLPIDADMFNWNIELTGPSSSPYAVPPPRLPASPPHTRSQPTTIGRHIQAPPDASQQLPVQATDPVVPHQDLPSECYQRR